MTRRCPWCGEDPLYQRYHDEEWGRPQHDERALFELLVLEGAQAGLSWLTVLRKREGYRRAFEGFDAARIARYGEAERARLLADPGIIRNRLKIDAAIANARALLALHEAGQCLSGLLWQQVDFQPRVNHWRSMAEVPASTRDSQALSRALRARGFRFVGPRIVYALMQAAGLVNDHLIGCFRHPASS